MQKEKCNKASIGRELGPVVNILQIVKIRDRIIQASFAIKIQLYRIISPLFQFSKRLSEKILSHVSQDIISHFAVTAGEIKRGDCRQRLGEH